MYADFECSTDGEYHKAFNICYSSPDLKINGSVISDGNLTTFGKYKFYHDGYEITDSFKSISGESVGRVDKVEIKNCVNRGKVSGDELVYSGKVDQNNKNSTLCAFIGGIAAQEVS